MVVVVSVRQKSSQCVSGSVGDIVTIFRPDQPDIEKHRRLYHSPGSGPQKWKRPRSSLSFRKRIFGRSVGHQVTQVFHPTHRRLVSPSLSSHRPTVSLSHRVYIPSYPKDPYPAARLPNPKSKIHFPVSLITTTQSRPFSHAHDPRDAPPAQVRPSARSIQGD